MFKKNKSDLQMAKEKVESAIAAANKKIEELGKHANKLYDNLGHMQCIFDKIRNVPTDKKLEYEKIKAQSLTWKQQSDKIESDYKNAEIEAGVAGTAGVGVGLSIVAMGPSMAMGVATTFGVASTGTAISTLSGAAATNAALAWLGGGALAAGGGGIAAGNVFLGLAGPIGWAIAGVTLATTGVYFFVHKKNKKCLDELFIAICERDINNYSLANLDIDKRIETIDDECTKLSDAISNMIEFGLDYKSMSKEQQITLGTYVNLMNISTQLIINPISGLEPKYSEKDFECFVLWAERKTEDELCGKYKNMLCREYKKAIISLATFLYNIEINEKEKILLWKNLKSNKDYLNTINMSKKEFGIFIFDFAIEALNYKYSMEKNEENA